MRADAGRHQRNLRVTSELKTLTKRFQAQLRDRQAPTAGDTLRLLTKKLDMACQKGILHHRTVSRTKGRLSRRLSQLAAPAATA